jgi:acyl-CoA thioesterase-2
MGDLERETAVVATGDGTYQATVDRAWEIWGPMGGYVAAIALRAAGADAASAGDGQLPVAFSCHYYRPAAFDSVDVRVEARKPGRAATSRRVEITQGGKAVLDAMVWSAAPNEGLEHDETVAPDVPGPGDLLELRELVDPDAPPPFPFWDNFLSKPVTFEQEWPPDGPLPPAWQTWLQFQPTATFDDPWVDACRSVILVDLPSWPSAHRPHAWTNPPYIAPTLDLNVAFHQSTGAEPWLLCDGAAPLSTGGLFGWTAKVWSPTGRLHASGGGQCLYRPAPPMG